MEYVSYYLNMLYVVLKDGSLEELPDAVTTDAVDGTLTCMNSDGDIIKRYERLAVLAFSHSEAIKSVVENLPFEDVSR